MTEKDLKVPVCRVCGERFSGHGNARYCSNECYGKYKEDKMQGIWSYFTDEGVLIEKKKFREGKEIN